MEIDQCANDLVAVCTNTIGSYDCKPAFSGDGFNCTGMYVGRHHSSKLVFIIDYPNQ